MRMKTALLLGSILLASVPAQADTRQSRADAKLAQSLEGLVAGEPVDCLNLRDIRSSRIIDRTAILYEAGGGTVYVNRPRAGREALDKWDVLVTRPHGGRLCSIDVVQLYDAGSRMQTGVVFLSDFVPYRRPKIR